jgi:hypothetical protein
LEEGRLQERRQDQTKKLDDESNCCNRHHLHLTLLLGWFLFCGCCFYIAYQNIRFEETENQISNIIRGTLRELIYESQTEMQNSQNAKMSVIFIKPEVVINKMNDHLKETDLIEEQDTKQHETAARNEHSMNAASSINESDNVVPTSDIDNLSITPLPEDLRDDRKFKKTSTWRINADKYDDIVANDNKAESFFLEKLYSTSAIPNVKMIDDEETENRNTLTEDNNYLTLNNFENGALNADASNKLKSSGSDVTMISNHNDLLNRKVIASPNNLRDTKFFDSVEDALHDRSNNGFSGGATTKRNLLAPLSMFDSFSLREYLESSDESWIPRSTLTQETFRQIENKSSHDTNATNEDGHQTDANDLLMPSPDSSMSENRAFLLPSSVPMASVENIENQHPLKIGTRNAKEDERSKSIEDIKDSFEFWVGSPTIKDIEEYPWIKSDSNYPFFESHYHAQKPLFKRKDPKSSQVLNPFLSSNEDTTIEDVVPKSRCKFEIASGIVTVRCPAIKFNEEWNLTSTENHTRAPQDVSRDDDSYENLYDDYYIECDEGAANQPKDVLISKENSDIKKTATSQHNDASTIIEAEKSASNVKISNDVLLESPKAVEMDSLANTRDNQDDAIYNANEKEQPVTIVSIFTSTSDTGNLDKRWNLKTADVQQKSTEKKNSGDFTDSSNNSRDYRSLRIVETDNSFEQRLIAMLNNEIALLRERQRKTMESNAKHASSEEYLDICNNYPLICDQSLIDSIFDKAHLKEASTYPHDSALAFRKKRMADDLTQLQGIIAYKNFILKQLKKRI